MADEVQEFCAIAITKTMELSVNNTRSRGRQVPRKRKHKEGSTGEQGSKLKFVTEDCDEMKEKATYFSVTCNEFGVLMARPTRKGN